jgi:hypothetical protein
MVRLRLSKTKPSGTTKSPGNSIQFSAGPATSLRENITQAAAKLASTAAHDKKLLSPRDRRVDIMMSAAAISGASSTHQGRLLSIKEFKT